MSRRGQRSNHPPNSGSDNDFSDVSDFGSDQDNSEGMLKSNFFFIFFHPPALFISLWVLSPI